MRRDPRMRNAVQNRAHAADIADMKAEQEARRNRSPRAFAMLEAIAPVYVDAYNDHGPEHPIVLRLEGMTDALLELIDEHKDLMPHVEMQFVDVIRGWVERATS